MAELVQENYAKFNIGEKLENLVAVYIYIYIYRYFY